MALVIKHLPCLRAISNGRLCKFTQRTLSNHIYCTTVVRNFSSSFVKTINSSKSYNNRESQNLAKESVHDDRGHLVYTGRVSKLFRTLKLFSLTTSAIGLCFQPYLIMTYQDMPLSAAVPFFGAINMFVFMNPILIHIVAKKYVSELYYNPESKVFTVVLMTFFARKTNFSFTAADVKVPDVPGMFAMFTAKGKPLFVNEGDFTSLEVYKHLMGFDRPMDLTFLSKEEKQE